VFQLRSFILSIVGLKRQLVIMEVSKIYLLVFCIFVSLSCVNSLYFHIAETERKCFIEEIPDDTTVIGKHVWKYCFQFRLRIREEYII